MSGELGQALGAISLTESVPLQQRDVRVPVNLGAVDAAVPRSVRLGAGDVGHNPHMSAYVSQLRELLGSPFTMDWPPLPCPGCGHTSLRLNREAVNVVESLDSKSAHSHPDFDPDWMAGTFTATLTCGLLTICGETVTIVGDARLHPVPEATGPGYSGDLEWQLSLRMARPALPLIKVPADCPDSVAKPLADASDVIWLDPSAAVNRMRVALEALMDVKRVQKWRAGRGSRRLTLHQRLEVFEQRSSSAREFLMAVKWLGNEASHRDVLTIEHALEAAEMVEYALELIYDDRVGKLTKRANQIVARRGLGRH